MTPDAFETKLVTIAFGLRVKSVSKVAVFPASFKIFLHMTLEPHSGHNQFPDLVTSTLS